MVTQWFYQAMVFSVVTIVGCTSTETPQRKSFEQGERAYEKSDFDLAISCFTEAIRLDPKNAVAYYFRSESYKWKGEKSKAEADWAEFKRLGGSTSADQPAQENPHIELH